MAVVESRTSLWEALAGRAPGQPLGPADVDLWQAVRDRLNPAKAKPRLRVGIEEVERTTVRGERYVMLRSPDRAAARYLRLTPDEVALAHRMDGVRTVASLVGEFARISGRLAPEQVLRLVADLAGNRMLDELPIDAFLPLERARRRPLPARIGRGLLATARGKRMVLGDVDRAVDVVYRWGGRLLFTTVAAVVLGLVIVAGMLAFGAAWAAGAESVFLVDGSYAYGALVLLGLNTVALTCHELGHALAAKHAGRRVPAMGVLLYFGIPCAFVDTTDVWMADRRARMLVSAAGPIASLAFAGSAQLVALAFPSLAPLAFKLAFVWYLNTLFNINPLMALDGYYLLLDWLDIANLRPMATAMLVGWVRRRRPRWSDLDREGRMIACYAVLALLWLVVMVNIMIRLYRDRVSGIVVGLWHSGSVMRLLLVVIVLGLLSPVVYAAAGWAARRWQRFHERLRQRRRDADLPRRVAALHRTALRELPEPVVTELAREARWLHPRSGETVAFAGPSPRDVLVVDSGAVVGRRLGDSPGTIRARATSGELIGAAAVLRAEPTALTWTTIGTRLLAIPAGLFASVVGPMVRLPLPHPGAATTPVAAGLHSGGTYPPLTPRPGPPPAGDDDADRRLLKRLAALLLLVGLFALLTGGIAARAPMLWAEMPGDRVLLTVERGNATADRLRLSTGDARYLAAGQTVRVAQRSVATLTYRGGGTVLLCPSATVAVDRVATVRNDRSLSPFGSVNLARGTVLADTTFETSAINPLSLTVAARDRTVVNHGPAVFAMTAGAAFPRVERGVVTVDGTEVRAGDGPLTCPGGVGELDSAGVAAGPSSTAPTPSTSVTTTTSTTTTTTPQTTTSTTTDPGPGAIANPPVTTTTTTKQPPLAQPPITTTTTTTPPDTIPPVIASTDASPSTMQPQECEGTTVSTIAATVTDNDSDPDRLRVWFDYQFASGSASGTEPMTHENGDSFTGALGPFSRSDVPRGGDRIAVVVTAEDAAGQRTTSDAFYVSIQTC